MSESQKILKTIKQNREKEDELNYCKKGYWLVRQSDKERFFISKDTDILALENICNKVLSEKKGYDYWIDYCLGLDVNRVPAWSNMDQTDRFF